MPLKYLCVGKVNPVGYLYVLNWNSIDAKTADSSTMTYSIHSIQGLTIGDTKAIIRLLFSWTLPFLAILLKTI